MKRRTVTAFEYQTLPVGGDGADDLSAAEAEVLLAIARDRRGFCTRGYRSIRLAQYTGLVNLGGRILEVLPKIGETADVAEGRGTLLRLLRLAYDLPPFARNPVGHDLRRDELIDVFVQAYLASLSSLVRSGLLRRYRLEEDDIGVVRGRLLLKRQATVLAMRSDRIACRFDELTVDNPWNQVLKASLLAIRSRATGIESGRLWVEMASAFDEVSPCADPVALHAGLALDRQVGHYRVAWQWAGWILRLLSPNVRAGTRQAPELLFDMNRLFEAAVTAVVRRGAIRNGLHLSAQDTGLHLAVFDSNEPKGFFKLRPDLVMRDGETVLAVADTKWSRLERDGIGRLIPDDGHVYQLNAYAGVYPCEEVVLIYPWHDGLGGAHPTVFRLPAVQARVPSLHVVCVDVSQDSLPFLMMAGGSQLARLV